MKSLSYRWLLLLVGFLAPGVHAATYYVAAGDDMTLAAVLIASPPSSLIVINQPPGGGAVFINPVFLNPNNSQTKIMAAPGEVVVWDVNGDVFTVTSNTRDVVLENLVIRGDFAGSGIEVQHNASVKVVNAQIVSKFNGVHVGSTPDPGPGGLAEIEGSRIFNTNFGVLLDGSFGARATVERSQIRNNDFGIWLPDVRSQIKIWQSIIDANRGYGINVGNRSFAVLNNNDISFNGADGVFFDQAARGSVSFNTVTFNTGIGINNLGGPGVTAAPGNNTIFGNSVADVFGIPVASNQIG